MQSSRFGLAALLACLSSALVEPALANVSCPKDLHGIPLIPGRPGEPQPGDAIEIPGFEGAYTTNCSYQGPFDDKGVEKHVTIRIVAKWHTVPDGDHFGCWKLRGLDKGDKDTPGGLGGSVFAKNHQAMVDVTVTDDRYYAVAKGQGSTMLQKVVGLSAKCRQPG
jgi:hypothetical protein